MIKSCLKKTLPALAFLALFFLFLGSAREVLGQECSNFRVLPPEGLPTETFTLEANCLGVSNGVTYGIYIYGEPIGDASVWDGELSFTLPTTLPSGRILEAGSHPVDVRVFDKVIGTAYLNLIMAAGQLHCGNPCAANSTDCPEECPCTIDDSGNWSCSGIGEVKKFPAYKPQECEWIPSTGIGSGGPITAARYPGIRTALGCIPTDPKILIQWLLTYVIGIAGGIAFLLMIYGTFLMMTSAGNPEQLNAGKEILTSAIIGLLFIIFSVFLLRLIGVTILRIPGFQ